MDHTRAYIPRVDMKAFPSSSLSASSGSSSTVEAVVLTVEYELRIRSKYFWMEQAAGGGRQTVVALTAEDPSEVDVRTFRPLCPGVFDHLTTLYPFNLLASFGIAEDDISRSQELRKEMFCFVRIAAHEAKITGNDRLKVVFAMNFCYWRTLPTPPEDIDGPDLERAVRESWELEEEERNTGRRRAAVLG